MQKMNSRGGEQTKKMRKRRMAIVICDLLTLLFVDLFILVVYPSSISRLSTEELIAQMILGAVCIFGCRFLGKAYRQIWRFGGSLLYLRLILLDALAGGAYWGMQLILPIGKITFIRTLSIVALNLLATISTRLAYQFLYEYSSRNSHITEGIRKVFGNILGFRINPDRILTSVNEERRINVAIVGAGRIGTMLADELVNNRKSKYVPRCFIDVDKEKIGRFVNGIPIFSEGEVNQKRLESFHIHEIIFALPNMSGERKKELYEYYKQTGCKLKVYDYPIAQTIEQSGKRHLREFDIEDLLFRKPMQFTDEATRKYYSGKTVLISGGGGSIGSELCRQIAKMKPRRLVILDVYENGAYDIQQELRIAYGEQLDLVVEIVSVCDRDALEVVFNRHRPEVVLHAAAHKHVPLMERNCCEAVKNNVFGTLNMVEVSEKFGVKKFTMISTDKAVNPTNVMGATKRMCEMIVQSREGSKTNFSATRFGNVLGSNGSVIPLFKRQISNGGPVTLTDKRIIRYFMTIPEASQLVLQSGAMAKNGELYVLDMGKPVKILELAENMIRLSGLEPYEDIDIVETGLRPGEKLYEELLIKSEELDKTGNSMIFIERDKPEGELVIRKKLDVLREALDTGDDGKAKEALKRVVPTYCEPSLVNQNAAKSEEMKAAVG